MGNFMSRRMKKKNKKEQIRSTRMMNFRILIVFGAIVVLCLCLIGRLIRLKQQRGKQYERKVLSQQSYVNNTIAARRGDILDRNGNKLASSNKVYNLILDPQLILTNDAYLEPTAKAVEELVGLEREELEEIVKKYPNQRYHIVSEYKGLQGEVKEKFEKEAAKNKLIKGVWFEEEYVRKYPYSTVGSGVIGFCSTDNRGIWGIENQYDATLTGSSGKSYGYYDSDLNLVQTVKDAVNGNKLISTIDVNIQGIVEQHIQRFGKETGSENLGVIIMNPKNGEIYAMASAPGFDLNHPNDLSALYSESEISALSEKQKAEVLNNIWRNYCISDSFEPGSTFKPITVAACLDEGTTTPSKTYFCDGAQKVADANIKCVAYSKGGHGTLNICQALMESCNDALMQMGADLGGKKFLQYVNAFGFGRKTGIDLPGEATGSIFTEETLRSTQLATSSFGQSQTVTMIQMAAAFSAVINGGNYYEPHVVKEIQSESGAVLETMDNALIRKVITEKSSERIRDYLFKTVEEGTAAPAKVKGYEIAGKTGTAEKIPRKHKNYLVSFIGFTPVEDPELVIYTVIDQPHVQDQAHSTFATELSSKILQDILPLLGIYKSSGRDNSNITLPSTKNGNQLPEAPEGGFSDKDYGTAEDFSGQGNSTAEPDVTIQPDVTSKPDITSEPVEGTEEPQADSTSEPKETYEPNVHSREDIIE